MKKDEIKILIVEDDKAFSEALSQLFIKAGYSVTTANTAEQALQLQKQNIFTAGLIDCLLPKMSGVDLALHFKAEGGLAGPLFLMSGIFRDKAFIKDSLTKTGAVQFISKPISPDEILKILESEISPMLDDSLAPLQDLLTHEQTTPGEKLAAIQSTSSIHGFELPRVVSYLMSCGSASDGVLTLTDSDGKVSQISFSGGRVVQITTQDRQSFFGVLLVERGLITHEKLEETLKRPNPDKRRLGERLVEANLLSPHWIPVVNTDQMAIRLSTMVQETMYDMKFQKTEITETEGQFDKPSLMAFLNDFINSKLTLEWLKNYYSSLMDSPVRRSKNAEKNHPADNFGPVIRLKNLNAEFERNPNLLAVMNRFPEQTHEFFMAVHMLVLNQLIYFPQKAKVLDLNVHISRLKQYQAGMADKDDFEILGVPRKAKATDIKKAYYELSKVYHPDRIAKSADQKIVETTKAIFSRITAAYNRLSDEEQRTLYLKELEVGQAEKILQAESIIEEGRNLLKSGNPGKALERFQFALTLRPPTAELNLLIIWAQLAQVSSTNSRSKEFITKSESDLGKIPPEERHNALYYFVRGLFYKHTGEFLLALDSISHAVSLKPEFFEAKRELHLLQISQKNKSASSSILTADLKDVVGLLFKRK